MAERIVLPRLLAMVICFPADCRSDDAVAHHQIDSSTATAVDIASDPTHASLLRISHLEFKGKLQGLDVTGSFAKPGCKYVDGETTAIADYDPAVEKAGRSWLEDLTGASETDCELRLISVEQVAEPKAEPSAEIVPLIRVKFRKFYRGIPTSDEARVELRKLDVETAHVYIHQLHPIEDSEQPLVSRKDAGETLRRFLRQFPNRPTFQDTDLFLEYRHTLYTNDKGKRKLCLAPFWSLKDVTFQIHALTGEVANND